MNKSYIKYTAIILSFTISLCVYSVEIQDNSDTDNSKTKTYTGTIVSLQTNQYVSGTDFSYDGFIDYVAKEGSLIHPQITDTEGNTIKQGTIIIQMRKDFWADIVLSDESAIYSAKADLLTALQDYKRYKDLTKIKTKVVSMEKYQQMRANYYDALTSLNIAQAKLLKDQIILQTCTQYAPFEGIVDKIYLSEGRACGNPQTIEISQLNPIGIKIKMSRKEAKKIKINSLVKVSKPNTNIVQGIYNGSSMLCEDGIILQTENKLKFIYDRTTYKGKIIPEVSDISFVDLFYNLKPNSKILSISTNSLMKDQKDFYVWKLLNTKALESTKGQKSIFKIKKIYVIPDNLKREIGGNTFYIALKDSGDLQINDLLLTTIPDKPLQDGDLVKLIENRYTFMPGDKVKILIDF
ncbi:MAG: hypothetical protein GY756_23010 [bacterium]|nr:hypothetical protein [bacterium]